MSGKQLTKLRDRIVDVMDRRIDDYPSGQDAEQIVDVFDRHVHAAAVAGGADCVITSDGSFTGLPLEVRDELSYEIYTPDEFFVLVDDSSPSTVRATLRYQLDYWKRQPGATKDPSTALVDANCPDFAARVKAYCQQIAMAG